MSSEATWHQAELIIGDARRFVKECDREGVALPPAASPVVDVDPPVAERVGPHPPQMVNAKYKVSYEKVVRRLGGDVEERSPLGGPARGAVWAWQADLCLNR